MKYPITTVALLGIATLFSPPAVRADNFVLDPTHTSIIFSISHLGYSFTYGRFNTCSGLFSLDGGNSQFSFSIDAGSLDTNDLKRDEHLRGADFFNVNQFPTITFQSTAVAVEGDVYNITGNLSMHGVTRQVTIPMKKLGEGPGPGGGYHSGFMTQFQIKRSDFGMTGMVGPIGDEVALSVSFEGIRQ